MKMNYLLLLIIILYIVVSIIIILMQLIKMLLLLIENNIMAYYLLHLNKYLLYLQLYSMFIYVNDRMSLVTSSSPLVQLQTYNLVLDADSSSMSLLCFSFILILVPLCSGTIILLHWASLILSPQTHHNGILLYLSYCHSLMALVFSSVLCF